MALHAAQNGIGNPRTIRYLARCLEITDAVAAAGALLTPVATPVNLMVMGPGGYTFTDYAKLGLPIMAWYFLVAVFYAPLFWPF